ncbi:hypothetical protein QBC35DRAFT_269735 [Podospora australis]|uniref:Uncharacterized protein n=1 Tax=Podospora australis TaxID=1536484 RepID=A0AAN6WR55_9PEZI|nr:hypothetical protein QBC35DRAFT_269735 [Podospora australis]
MASTPPSPHGSQRGADSASAGTQPAQNGNDPQSSTQKTTSSVSSSSVGENMAQALKDLARGDQAATAIEAHLTNFESKLDALLASLGIPPGALDEEADEPMESGVGEKAADGKADTSGKNA